MNRTVRCSLIALLTFVFIASGCAPAATPTPSPTATEPPAPTNTNAPPAATMTATTAPTATPTEIPVFWDDFDGELQPGWTWIRENDALWSITSDGYLRIVLQGGSLPRNLLVRDVASENFQIVTHVLFTPTSNFQFAGLLVYQDDNTKAAFGRAYCNTQNACVGNGVYFDRVDKGQWNNVNYATDTKLKDEAYLRLDKVGNLFSAYYSEDGSNWTLIGEHEVIMLDPKVGLIATNSNVAGMVALFDYFTLMETP